MLSKQIKAKIQKILGKYPTLFGYVFGSYAKDKIGPLSDLDVAVYFKPDITEDKRWSLKYDIKDDIEVALKMLDKVDVVSLNDAPPFLEYEVVYKGKRIYNIDDEARAHYEAGAIGRWLDWKYYADQFDRAIEKEIGKPIKPYLWQIKK